MSVCLLPMRPTSKHITIPLLEQALLLVLTFTTPAFYITTSLLIRPGTQQPYNTISPPPPPPSPAPPPMTRLIPPFPRPLPHQHPLRRQYTASTAPSPALQIFIVVMRLAYTIISLQLPSGSESVREDDTAVFSRAGGLLEASGVEEAGGEGGGAGVGGGKNHLKIESTARDAQRLKDGV
ncbi:MAG: hypothetical protein Q9227_002528 [Pyrenula ochraceoflavens]